MENKLTLEELFKDYKGDYKNQEVDWGEDVGLERYWEYEDKNGEEE